MARYTQKPKAGPRDERPSLRRGEATGRDGEVITRMRDSNTDPFHIDRSEVPEGWDYEWKRLSYVGKVDRVNVHRAGQAGWRPVMADRFPGRWHDVGYAGAIEFEGMGLFERPAKLTREAREDDAYAARTQLEEARGEFKFRSPDPSRFDPNDKQAQGYQVMRSEVVGSPTAIYPQLEIAGDSD